MGVGVLDSSRVINGSFGEVWKEGKWLTNFGSAEASVEITKEEVKRAGTRWIGHKVTALKGTGTITGFKITTELIEEIGQITNDRKGAFVTELILKLDDPEAFNAFRVRLKGVMFDTIPLVKFEAGALVEDEFQFTFDGYEFLDKIEKE